MIKEWIQLRREWILIWLSKEWIKPHSPGLRNYETQMTENQIIISRCGMKQAMIKWKLVYSGRKVFTTAVHSILFYCILYVSQITCPHGPGYINQRFFSRVGLGAAETILYDFRVFPLQSGTRRENTDPSHLLLLIETSFQKSCTFPISGDSTEFF